VARGHGQGHGPRLQRGHAPDDRLRRRPHGTVCLRWQRREPGGPRRKRDRDDRHHAPGGADPAPRAGRGPPRQHLLRRVQHQPGPRGPHRRPRRHDRRHRHARLRRRRRPRDGGPAVQADRRGTRPVRRTALHRRERQQPHPRGRSRDRHHQHPVRRWDHGDADPAAVHRLLGRRAVAHTGHRSGLSTGGWRAHHRRGRRGELCARGRRLRGASTDARLAAGPGRGRRGQHLLRRSGPEARPAPRCRGYPVGRGRRARLDRHGGALSVVRRGHGLTPRRGGQLGQTLRLWQRLEPASDLAPVLLHRSSGCRAALRREHRPGHDRAHQDEHRQRVGGRPGPGPVRQLDLAPRPRGPRGGGRRAAQLGVHRPRALQGRGATGSGRQRVLPPRGHDPPADHSPDAGLRLLRGRPRARRARRRAGGGQPGPEGRRGPGPRPR
jgi:hypothetical protein